MTATMTCKTCHTALVGNSIEGLCPPCLLRRGLEPTRDGGEEAVEAAPSIRYFGNYELLGEIARGGMGVVYKARQASLNRIVAVKTILAGQFADEDAVRRFRAEAEAAANLQHPNIVAIHEVGEVEGFHYFSMEYVEGKNLAQLLREGPMPAEKLATLLRKAALAIQYAHQRGILHRDLKPSNILIDAHGEPRITDFGLAKVMGADGGLTRSGLVVGSPSYMSPEQAGASEELLGPASDVYSLGAILYEALTGRAPHVGASGEAILAKVVNDEPAAPRKLKPEAPVDLETICLKCLEKSPARRYATARELADDLDRFLRHEPILAKPIGALRKAAAWMRRHTWAFAALVAVALLCLAGGVIYLSEQNDLLRLQQAGGDRAAEADHRLRFAGLLDGLYLPFLYLFVFVSFAHSTKSRGIRWKDMFDPASLYRPQRTVGPKIRAWMAASGAACLLYALALGVQHMRFLVWGAGSVRFPASVMVFVFGWWGALLLLQAWRDHQRSLFGSPHHDLSSEQRALIRKAIEALDLPAAIKLYRSFAPGADLATAREFVAGEAGAFRERSPEEFSRMLPKPWDINWTWLTGAALIETLAVWLYVTLRPPVSLRARLLELGAGIALGLAVMIGARCKGFWKRMTAFMVPVLAYFLLLPRLLPKDETGHGANMMVGTVLGVLLMVSGYTRSRKRRPAA